jgi:hypothetical protein
MISTSVCGSLDLGVVFYNRLNSKTRFCLDKDIKGEIRSNAVPKKELSVRVERYDWMINDRAHNHHYHLYEYFWRPFQLMQTHNLYISRNKINDLLHQLQLVSPQMKHVGVYIIFADE